MALAVTCTAVSGSEIHGEFSGAEDDLTVYLTTSSTYAAEDPPDPDHLGTPVFTSQSASGEFDINNISATGTVYVVATDNTTIEVETISLPGAKEFSSGVVPGPVTGTPQFTTSQYLLPYQAHSVTLPIETSRNTAVVAFQTTNELTDAILTGILTDSNVVTLIGASPTFQLVAKGSPESLDNFDPYLQVTTRVNYLAKNN